MSVKVGDKLYRVMAEGLEEVKVSKVGRKYFYLEDDYRNTRFVIDGLRLDSNFGCRALYRDKQVYLDEQRLTYLRSAILDAIPPYGPVVASLEDLEKIATILGIE